MATEDRANISLSDEPAADDKRLSAVLLDHKKKRVKRIARFWLGEGFERPKPHLRQPNWVYEAGNSCLALLLTDPARAYARASLPVKGRGKAKKGKERIEAAHLLHFVRRKLTEIQVIARDQQDKLKREVAFATKAFVPFSCSRKEKRRIEGEAQVFCELITLREQLEAFGQKMSVLLEAWEPEAWALDQSVDFNFRSPESASAERAANATSHPNMLQDRKRAYSFVEWVVQGKAEAKEKALEGLIELIGLDSAPNAKSSEEELAAAEKRLILLLHPDKAPPDMQLIATCAFQDRELAMAEVRKSLRCPNSSSGQTQQPAKPSGAAERLEILVDVNLRSWLSGNTQDALDAMLAAHVELLKACTAVRTASSSFLKGALLRRGALVFCTLTVAGRSSICGQQIPTVLIDEACQACEAETLLALRSWVQRLFLVGDPRQLPATIASPVAKRAGYARSMLP